MWAKVADEVGITLVPADFTRPVDPTFNQFPADTTHLRLARGGLEKQATILPMIGRLKMTVLDLELAPGSVPILVGSTAAVEAQAPMIPTPQRSSEESCNCWSEMLMPRFARIVSSDPAPPHT